MADGVAKGIGEQLGQLGKQIVTEVAKVPAKIVGIDETLGASGGKGQKGQTGKKSQTDVQTAVGKDLEELRSKDETEKQKQLAQARRLLQQFIQPPQEQEYNVKEKLEMEEMEKQKKEIEEEKKKAALILPQVGSKRARGDLFGVKAKKFGGELGKNVKSG